MQQKNTRRGFTLIELLVVVLIIAILAAVAVPQYQKTVEKSRAAKALGKMYALDQAQRAYYLANGTFATQSNHLDIENLPACHSDGGTIVFCQWSASNNMIFEWHGNTASGKTSWLCLARTTKETANKLCSGYHEEWGKARAPYENPNGYTYYYGKWK